MRKVLPQNRFIPRFLINDREDGPGTDDATDSGRGKDGEHL